MPLSSPPPPRLLSAFCADAFRKTRMEKLSTQEKKKKNSSLRREVFRVRAAGKTNHEETP